MLDNLLKRGSKMRPFNCDGCNGMAYCCRSVGHISSLPSTDGVCHHLVNGRCDIYATRPDICNVEKCFNIPELNPDQLDWEEYCEANLMACLQIKLKYLRK